MFPRRGQRRRAVGGRFHLVDGIEEPPHVGADVDVVVREQDARGRRERVPGRPRGRPRGRPGR